MSARQFVDGLISTKPVVIFSKKSCPGCVTAKLSVGQAIKDAGMGTFGKAFIPECVELDKRSDGDAIMSYLEQKTGRNTVPSVWIDGTFVGGGDETKAEYDAGRLSSTVKAAVENRGGCSHS